MKHVNINELSNGFNSSIDRFFSELYYIYFKLWRPRVDREAKGDSPNADRQYLHQIFSLIDRVNDLTYLKQLPNLRSDGRILVSLLRRKSRGEAFIDQISAPSTFFPHNP